MAAAPRPLDENARLSDLRRYRVLDTTPEEAFDALTRLAGQIAQTPFALISLTDDSRQWFKSRIGVELQEIPREWAPCAHVVYSRQNILCADTRLDPRFADNPLVTGAPHVRFYGGIALLTPRGSVLGTLAVMDTRPRILTPFQIEALELLAKQVVDQLELRMAYRDLALLRAQEQEFEARLFKEKTDEVQRLAAELHDGVGQDLVGISILLAVMRRIPPAQHAALQKPLQEVTDLLNEAIANCRRMAETQGGFLLKREGLQGALRRMTKEFKDSPAIALQFSGEPIRPDCLSELAAYHLLRIAREAVINAKRHSRSAAILVRCTHLNNEICVTVQDEGRGIALEEECKGLGRPIMEYRARSIGADLRFTKVEPSGLKVACRISCRHAHAPAR